MAQVRLLYNVSEENMRKVEDFFIGRMKQDRTNRIDATVAQIAEGSGVSLATAHKALTKLKDKGILEVKTTSKTRRFPLTYYYHGEKEVIEERDQLESLQKLVAELREEIEQLKEENAQLRTAKPYAK